MTIVYTGFLYSMRAGGTNQYTVDKQIQNGSASFNAGDNILSVNETVQVTFASNGVQNKYGGSFKFLGTEPGLDGYVFVSNGNYYLLSPTAMKIPNQNFNIRQINSVVCFMPGTRILTPLGEVAVETLKVGDLVMTTAGDAKPVRWIGRQTVSRVFADPLRVLPIRIKGGALGENTPCRDLLISPDHAILVDGVLVQAAALVNGSSIVREQAVPQVYTYYHVELDDHSLILAENVAAETFVDNVDRLGFDNWAEYEALYPNGKAIEEMTFPRAKSFRQIPQSTRNRLAARGEALYGGLAAVA